jgi:TPR repeat protein
MVRRKALAMSQALRTAAWMTLLLASSAGCIRVVDMPSDAAPQHEHGSEARSSGGTALFSACQAGEAPRYRASACLILAGYFGEGRFGLPHDPERAMLLWQSAVDILEASCSLGEVADCTGAAAAIEMGLATTSGARAAVAEEAEWMVQYAEHGCRGGDAAGCALLGRVYERGWGVARDMERSAECYDRACEAGHRQSCLFLASRAQGADAVRAYERACQAGSGFGCATAAQHHRKGAGVEVSVERAGALFERGCKLGDPASCVLGAEMFSGGPSADRRRAAELGWEGCDQGIPGACLVLGEVLERAERPRSARRAFRRACEMGEMRACTFNRLQGPVDEGGFPDLGD